MHKMDKQFLSLLVILFSLQLVLAAHPLPTDFSNSTQGLLIGMGTWANTVTNGLFWTMMLLGFCIVLWVATNKYTSDRAFGFAGTAGLFGSMFLATAGLITWWIATIFIIVGAVSIVSMIISRSK